MRILIISLGGTIAMARDSADFGGIPRKNADDFAALLHTNDEIFTKSFCNLPSGSLDFGIIIEMLRYAREMADSGIEAIIITQGTDTIEESSFLFNLLWDNPVPVVFCGAMKMSDEPGYDGVRNLASSIALAKSPNARNRGVLVVFGDRIFSANWIVKTHTTFMDAFEASTLEGVIIENEARFFAMPLTRKTFPIPRENRCILFLEQNLGEENLALGDLSGIDGIIIAGFGSGHISAETQRHLESVKIPIIVASRNPLGFATKRTYGYEGSEITLQNIGAIMSGMLNARRARILLWVILGNGLKLSEFEAFEASLTLH